MSRLHCGWIQSGLGPKTEARRPGHYGARQLRQARRPAVATSSTSSTAARYSGARTTFEARYIPTTRGSRTRPADPFGGTAFETVT
jgi:hypothetical protein